MASMLIGSSGVRIIEATAMERTAIRHCRTDEIRTSAVTHSVAYGGDRRWPSRQLKGLSRLKSLYLDDTQAGDEGMAAVWQFSRLQEFGLTNTPVSDKGIARLYRLKPLPTLFVYETKASLASIAKLRKWMPKAKIWCGSDRFHTRSLSRSREKPNSTVQQSRLQAQES